MLVLSSHGLSGLKPNRSIEEAVEEAVEIIVATRPSDLLSRLKTNNVSYRWLVLDKAPTFLKEPVRNFDDVYTLVETGDKIVGHTVEGWNLTHGIEANHCMTGRFIDDLTSILTSTYIQPELKKSGCLVIAPRTYEHVYTQSVIHIILWGFMADMLRLTTDLLNNTGNNKNLGSGIRPLLGSIEEDLEIDPPDKIVPKGHHADPPDLNEIYATLSLNEEDLIDQTCFSISISDSKILTVGAGQMYLKSSVDGLFGGDGRSDELSKAGMLMGANRTGCFAWSWDAISPTTPD